jgi:membrane protease YdiL (CAAX protease family)
MNRSNSTSGRPRPTVLPLVALVARPMLSLAAQSGVALILRRKGRPAPFRAAAGWWMVYGSAVDVGCVALVAAAARVEAVELREAAGLAPRPRRRARSSLVDVAALVPAAVVSQLLARPLSPDAKDPLPAQLRVCRLDGIARAYSIAVWPGLWAASEEITYLGYALSHLERRFGTPLASLLTVVAWAAQHAVIPSLPGWRYAWTRAVTMLPVSAAFVTVYLARGRRLAPLMTAHWASDTTSAVLAVTMQPALPPG